MVHIDSLIKVWGSLMWQDEKFNNMIAEIEELAISKNIVLTTWSKDISDIVRERLVDILGIPLWLDNHIDITWKSRDIMSQVFTDVSDKLTPVYDLNDISHVINKWNIPVIIQYELLKKFQPFPLERWLSTDTTSAFFAHKLNAKNFIKLTNVDWVYSNINDSWTLLNEIDTKTLKWMGKTCICTALSWFLEKFNIICNVANWNNIDNLKIILSWEQWISTTVIPFINTN
jgi:aspartokinase-like uncharacterized kinase